MNPTPPHSAPSFPPVTNSTPGVCFPSNGSTLAGDTFATVPLVSSATAPATPEPNLPPAFASPKRSKIWDVPFDHVTLEGAVDAIGQLIDRGVPSYVITANLNYAMLHHRHADMEAITREAALILADGQPIVWRSRLAGDRLPERVAGSEMIYGLMQRCSQNRWPVYFLGGEPGVAAACAKRLYDQYPGLQVAGVESPPFRELSADEQAAQDDRIRNSGAKLLLVAFGQPKGERWIHQNYRRLGVPVSIQLGASFDFIAGTARRAPKAWQMCGMEWAYRMLSDPKRLVPRYLSNATFLAGALANDWQEAVVRWGMWPGVDTDRVDTDRAGAASRR